MRINHTRWIHSGITFLLLISLSACVSATPTSLPTLTTTKPPAGTPTSSFTPSALPTKKPPTATSVSPTLTLAEGMLMIPGPEVTFQGVKLNLPANLASGVRAQVAPAADKLGELYPVHIEFTLTDYDSHNTWFEPQILIYPVSKLGETAAGVVQELKQLIAKKPTTLPPNGIPILPTRPAGQLIDVQIQYLTFTGGSGIRVLTQFAQNTWPINNADLVYVFQGMTTDGDYYVSAFLPVAAFFLPNRVHDPDTIPPVDGNHYPKFDSANFDAEYRNYHEAVTRKLNTKPANEFAPDLSGLDSLIESLQVELVAASNASITDTPMSSPTSLPGQLPEASPTTGSLTDPCLNALPTRLSVGMFAYVNPSPPLPNNVRSDPGKKYSVIGDIEAGKAMKILKGPECVDGWIWWKVRALDTELQGWTAEGDSKNYWLIPCESRNSCGP